MTIHRSTRRSMGWNYAGIAIVLIGLAIALIVVASGAFSVKLNFWRPVLYVGATALVMLVVVRATRRN